MNRLHPSLPPLDGRLLLNDRGMETPLVFHEGMALPAFAAFPLLETEAGREWLTTWFGRHLALAERYGTGFVLDTPTWRANRDWGGSIGYGKEALAGLNRTAVAFCTELRTAWQARVSPIVVAGVIGPWGDGYLAGTATAAEAELHHAPQIDTLAEAGVDLVSAYTLTTIAEAIGNARAAAAVGIPAAISFIVETDGRLASGPTLAEAITAVDEATGGSPAYYVINCAHPSHFESAFAGNPTWAARIRGLKANASTVSHAALEAMTTLDAGNPDDLAERYARLRRILPGLSVLGSCCGTEHTHVASIARRCCNDKR